LSLHLSRLGKIKEAEEEIQKARALDPLSPIIATDAAQTAYWARNPQEAEKRMDAVLATNPDFAEGHLVQGKILEQLGHYELALAEFKEALMLFRVGPNVEALRAHALALGGASEQALSIAHPLEADAHASGVDIGAIYCALGQPDAAMHWFQSAWLHRDKGIDMLGIDPMFDGCRSDPRFQALLKKLKL
jgi:tetratricopeptide (TPR) repeat protein